MPWTNGHGGRSLPLCEQTSARSEVRGPGGDFRSKLLFGRVIFVVSEMAVARIFNLLKEIADECAPCACHAVRVACILIRLVNPLVIRELGGQKTHRLRRWSAGEDIRINR